MAEVSQIMFSHAEIAEQLVKKQGIHEGHWGISIRFGLGATNAIGPSGKLTPTAVLPVIEIGIQKFEEPNDLTIDAAIVNPPTKKPLTKNAAVKREVSVKKVATKK